MDTLPKPGKIVKEARRDAVGITEWTLSNGARVVVKPTDYEADRGVAARQLAGRRRDANDKLYPRRAVRRQHRGARRGRRPRREELGKMLAGKHVTAAAEIGETTETVEAGASVRDLETMFQLVHLEMTAPRKDGPRDRGVAAEPQGAAAQPGCATPRSSSRSSRRRCSTRATRGAGRSTRPTSTSSIRPRRSRSTRIASAMVSDFTFVIVGAFDRRSSSRWSRLPGEPARQGPPREAEGPPHPQGARRGQASVDARPGAQGAGPDPVPRRGAVDARQGSRHVHPRQVLEIRLREVLREDKGGVYGVGVGGAISRAPFQEETHFHVGRSGVRDGVGQRIQQRRQLLRLARFLLLVRIHEQLELAPRHPRIFPSRKARSHLVLRAFVGLAALLASGLPILNFPPGIGTIS